MEFARAIMQADSTIATLFILGADAVDILLEGEEETKRYCTVKKI
jgi:hypothetical protein